MSSEEKNRNNPGHNIFMKKTDCLKVHKDLETKSEHRITRLESWNIYNIIIAVGSLLGIIVSLKEAIRRLIEFGCALSYTQRVFHEFRSRLKLLKRPRLL